jgi:hypothetical protein
VVTLGNGDGTFETVCAYAIGAQPVAILVGAFGAAGLTFVTANAATGTLALLSDPFAK